MPVSLSYHELVSSFRKLGLSRSRPVIAHASLSAFGPVRGGAQTLLGALLAASDALLMPVFTYQTMVHPLVGPPDNGMRYDQPHTLDRQAVFFRPDLPADRSMGILPETLRRHPQAQRSLHPILSFAGVNVEDALQAQTYEDPLAPLQSLAAQDALVLLLGVDQTVNTSIHLAEQLAGRKPFTRWALTLHGVRACPGFPGCSDGFNSLAPALDPFTLRMRVGQAIVQAIPLSEIFRAARQAIKEDPQALLCSRTYCERCQTTRTRSLGGN